MLKKLYFFLHREESSLLLTHFCQASYLDWQLERMFVFSSLSIGSHYFGLVWSGLV